MGGRGVRSVLSKIRIGIFLLSPSTETGEIYQRSEKRALSARRLFLWMVGVLTRLYLAFFFFFFVRAVRLTATEIATVRVSSLPGDHS